VSIKRWTIDFPVGKRIAIIIFKRGKCFYKDVLGRIEGNSQQNASPLSFHAGLAPKTPGLGDEKLRKALCPFPAARSPAHCLGVRAVALHWAVSTRREDNAWRPPAQAAAADCSGRRGHCRGLPSPPSLSPRLPPEAQEC
jgi:hypothetical protein